MGKRKYFTDEEKNPQKKQPQKNIIKKTKKN